MSKPIIFDEILIDPTLLAEPNGEPVICTGPCCAPWKYALHDAAEWQGAKLYVVSESGEWIPLETESGE